MPAEDDPLKTPNCPACLTRMEPKGDPERPESVHWACPSCGLAKLA